MNRVKSTGQYWNLPSHVIYLNIVVSFLTVYDPSRLTEKHDGKYLTSVLALCVKRYGLEDFISNHGLYVGHMADCLW